MARDPEKAEVGQPDADQQSDPPDREGDRRLRAFLDDLGRLSARHGLWIVNSSSGAIIRAREDAAGYQAWPWSGGGRERICEVDSYASGHSREGEGVVVGEDRFLAVDDGAGSEDDGGSPRTGNMEAELGKLHEGIEPDKLTFRRLDPDGPPARYQAFYAGHPVPGLIMGVADDGSHRIHALELIQRMRRCGDLQKLLAED